VANDFIMVYDRNKYKNIRDMATAKKTAIETTKENKELIAVFKIFTNKHKLAILSFLKKKKSAPVGVIADNIGVSFKTTSKYLLYIAKKGILKRRYDGNFVRYQISDNLPESVRLIISHLL
jgi:DNA-binding transcriptional ArsR family regulator